MSNQDRHFPVAMRVQQGRWSRRGDLIKLLWWTGDGLCLLAKRLENGRYERVQHLKAQLDTRTAEIEHLKLLIAKLQRMQFGRSCEKVERQIEQLELKLEDLEAETGAACRFQSTQTVAAALATR